MISDNDVIATMLNATPVCGSVWSRDGLSVACNDAALRFFALADKQAYLDHYTKLSPACQSDGEPSALLLRAHLHKAFTEGRTEYSWLHCRLDGEIIPARITLTRVRHGGSEWVVAYAIEQAGSRPADRAIHNANARARLILDNAPLACHFWNARGDIIDCNQASLRLLGLSSKQELLTRFSEFLPEYQPDGRCSNDLTRQYVLQTLQTGCSTMPIPWMRRTVTGEPLPTETTMVRIMEDGEPMLAVFVRDLREELKQLAEKHEANEYIQMMLDATPLSISLWNEARKKIACNQEAVNLFGLENKQDVLDRFYELSPEYQPCGRLSSELAHEYIGTAFREGNMRFEWLHQKLDGELIPAEVTLVRVARNDSYIVVCYVRDLRELKQTVSGLKQMKKLAYTDKLTGVGNRRYFQEHAAAELARLRPGGSASLLILDLDHFKKINDTYGHVCGDLILQHAVERIRNILRPYDLFARYGGEEFVILLARSRLNDALSLAERIRESIAYQPFEYQGHTIKVTVSIGVTSCANEAPALQDLVDRADKSLYQAKRNGRNLVVGECCECR